MNSFPLTRVLLACMLSCVLAVGALAGCGGSRAESSASSTQASSTQVEEHEALTVAVYLPANLEGLVDELADAYTAESSWLSFDVQAFEGADSLQAALFPDGSATPTEGVPVFGGLIPSSSSSVSSDSSSSAAEEETYEPVADIVFTSSQAVMDQVELGGAADPATRLDMVEDRLVLACADDSELSAVTTADLQAGLHRVVLAPAGTDDGAVQREALANLGLYTGGAFAGALAENATLADSSDTTSSTTAGLSKAVEAESVAAQFELLANDPQAVGIVRASDLRRYGGLKEVGAVPSQLYSALRYPLAFAPLPEADGQEGADDTAHAQEVRRVSEAFAHWMLTDEDALRIIEKWGFRLSA